MRATQSLQMDKQMKPSIKENISEWIALIVTVVISIVFVDFAALMTYTAVTGKPVDREISGNFNALLVAFVAVWKTNFAGSTTVNTEQANVSAGTGSPSPANVERMTVTNTETPSAERRGVNGP